jgi:hypothetical protein
MAVGRLGVSTFIGDLQAEKSTVANTCRIFYEGARERTLEDFAWNFANRVSDLQDIGSPPAGWLYRFAYPNDCVKAHAINPSSITALDPAALYPGDIVQFRQTAVPFMIVEDEANGGRAILCNVSPASLLYTARITNMSMWSQGAIDALAWTLASDIGAPLSAQPGMAAQAAQAYTATLLKASANNANEGREEQQGGSELLDARN